MHALERAEAFADRCELGGYSLNVEGFRLRGIDRDPFSGLAKVVSRRPAGMLRRDKQHAEMMCGGRRFSANVLQVPH
ncbi:hypothetical protein [Bradyrhizobium liaoningense]|uniref:hypothetical protein n=1 Tax=Bradyrhizobium liaoningense TaxID=43992 RepID=UPI001BADE22E|nr:hypothetical protein [Bradyrhizobium liaoningense]MBR1033045.1 hypothetical protein [Bradyrhizobium liaoningense]